MTYEEREQLLSKEALRLEDLMALLDISRSAASELAIRIKRSAGDRLGIKGRVHILDFFKFFGIDDRSPRYYQKVKGLFEGEGGG